MRRRTGCAILRRVGRLTYHFPPFRLQVDEQLLWRGHEAVQLRHKTLALLKYLLDHHSQLVTCAQLMNDLWDKSAQPAVVKTTVHELRKALGDDEQRILKTVKRFPRHAYCMDVAVQVESEPEPAPRAAPPLLPLDRGPPAEVPALPLGPDLSPPPLGGFSADWYVPRPREERDALQRLHAPGAPAVLVGPESIGKSWTLHAIRQRAERELPGAQVIHINLRTLDTADFTSSEAFFHALALRLCAAAAISESALQELWAGSASPLQRLGALVERCLLTKGRGAPLLLVIDHADQADRGARVASGAGAPGLSSQLLGTLRTWAERSREPESPFRALRLLLGVSTSLASLISNIHQSPLNLSDPIEIGDLDDAQAQLLLLRSGIALDSRGRAALQALVGGHPYFLHALCYTARVAGWTQITEIARPAAVQRALGPHLTRCLDLLRRTPSAGPDPSRSLLSVLRAAVQPAATAAIDPEDEARLQRAGLLKPRGGGGYQLRYPIYGVLPIGGEGGAGGAGSG